jgi:hypothetical protein
MKNELWDQIKNETITDDMQYCPHCDRYVEVATEWRLEGIVCCQVCGYIVEE